MARGGHFGRRRQECQADQDEGLCGLPGRPERFQTLLESVERADSAELALLVEP
ncbi:hypothetical protein QF037_009819 [Streptomyces canus]|uniref:hypothetical protein n=1 Tax=Streptomyces canus TaxID=58343 RepID=UPI00277E5A67|nr:hypothetical protein [Streptomyces canus]MDQ0605474.1 hypothetical protein [Streptomyces canus]